MCIKSVDIKINNFRKWNESILEEVYNSLLEELPLADNAPGGMIKYRRSLTLRCNLIKLLNVKDYINKVCYNM